MAQSHLWYWPEARLSPLLHSGHVSLMIDDEAQPLQYISILPQGRRTPLSELVRSTYVREDCRYLGKRFDHVVQLPYMHFVLMRRAWSLMVSRTSDFTNDTIITVLLEVGSLRRSDNLAVMRFDYVDEPLFRNQISTRLAHVAASKPTAKDVMRMARRLRLLAEDDPRASLARQQQR